MHLHCQAEQMQKVQRYYESLTQAFQLEGMEVMLLFIIFWKQKWQVYTRLDCIVNTKVEENSWDFPLRLGVDR